MKKPELTLCLQFNGDMPQISSFNKKVKDAGRLVKRGEMPKLMSMIDSSFNIVRMAVVRTHI